MNTPNKGATVVDIDVIELQLQLKIHKVIPSKKRV